MSRTSYKTKQEVIDTIKEMREYPRWSWNMVANIECRLDGKFHRALKRSWA